jgi:GrpB-like predicted nucleotidyltransferase (UPF0157 family)
MLFVKGLNDGNGGLPSGPERTDQYARWVSEMIGLRRNTVRIVDHHPDWMALATEACRWVRLAGDDLILDVQHVGSTSVPDLPAKPILDLAAAVATLDAIPELIERLTARGPGILHGFQA